MVTAWEAADEQALPVLRAALSPSSLPSLVAGPLTALAWRCGRRAPDRNGRSR
jgi:hypothetical protein